MKKIILGLCLILAVGTMGFAQCGQKLVFTSSKTVYLDSIGTVQRNVDEQSIIELSPTNLSITPGGGDSMNLTITIEGKEGKITFLAVIEQMPDRRIMLLADKFEEKNKPRKYSSIDFANG